MASGRGQPVPTESDQESFRIRPRGPRHRENTPRVHSGSFARLTRALRTASRVAVSRESRPARAANQRCAVRFTYSRNRIAGHFGAHAKYLVRDSAAGGSAPYGSLGEEPMPTALARWQGEGDRRLYKLIVSPEFGERIDLSELATGLVAAIERDLFRELEWAAVNHFNTDHPHIHIAIRCKDREGREFRFPRSYVTSGLREQAERLCTEQLGHRTGADIEQARWREVDQHRFTSLDRSLMRRAEPREDDASRVRVSLAGPRDTIAGARLRFLENAGIARESGPGCWTLPIDMESTLRAMRNVADRQRMLAQCGTAISDDRLPHRITLIAEIDRLRGRVLGHIENETSGRVHLVLEGTDGMVHFIPHDPNIDTSRARGDLRPGHFVSLERHGGITIRDHGDANAYLRSPEFSVVPFPGESTGSEWRGWLGQYRARLAGIERGR